MRSRSKDRVTVLPSRSRTTSSFIIGCIPGAKAPAYNRRQVSAIIMLFHNVKLALAAAACSIALPAQWLQLPTPGMPLGTDGKPNFSAPAPRTLNGKPDLSGIWELQHPPCPAGGCSDYVG